jgi:WD40 repeat protein
VHMCSASYNSDSTLYIGASNGSVSSWDTRDNACVASWTISSTEVTSIVANGSKMITGCLGSVKLWTIEGANLDALVLDEEMELDGGVTSMSFDSVAMMGVVSTTAATIWYINWPENSSVRLTSGHYDQIRALTCSSDDTVLASGGDDGTVRLWAIKEHTQILQFQVWLVVVSLFPGCNYGRPAVLRPAERECVSVSVYVCVCVCVFRGRVRVCVQRLVQRASGTWTRSGNALLARH